MVADTYIFRSEDVALYLVACANEKKIVVNITKVQKLLYIIYGTYLRVFGKRLLDEHPQAWPYGPVFPLTRTVIKRKIKTEYLSFPMDSVNQELRQDANLNKTIDFVLSHFGKWNAGQLTEWSHRDGSPWALTVNKDGFSWGWVIPDEYILDFFTKLVRVPE